MGDRNKGLYGKFNVERTDGSSKPGKKHHGCRYYILDLNHDKHAAPALEAYAASCNQEYPLLARDLRKLALELRGREAGDGRVVCYAPACEETGFCHPSCGDNRA